MECENVQIVGLWGRVFAKDLFKCGRMLREHILGSDVKIVKFQRALDVPRKKTVVIHLRSSHIKSALRASSQNSKRQCGCNRRQELISSPHDFSGERYDLVMVVITVSKAKPRPVGGSLLAEARYFFGIWSVFQVWCRICGIVQDFPHLETKHQIKQGTKTLQMDMAYLSNTTRVILPFTYPTSLQPESAQRTRHPCSMVGTKLDVVYPAAMGHGIIFTFALHRWCQFSFDCKSAISQ